MYSRQWAVDRSSSPGEMGSVNSPNLNFNRKMFNKLLDLNIELMVCSIFFFFFFFSALLEMILNTPR